MVALESSSEIRFFQVLSLNFMFISLWKQTHPDSVDLYGFPALHFLYELRPKSFNLWLLFFLMLFFFIAKKLIMVRWIQHKIHFSCINQYVFVNHDLYVVVNEFCLTNF